MDNWPEKDNYNTIEMYDLAKLALETIANEELESRVEFHQDNNWYQDTDWYSGEDRISYVKDNARYDKNRRVITRRVSKSWIEKEQTREKN